MMRFSEIILYPAIGQSGYVLFIGDTISLNITDELTDKINGCRDIEIFTLTLYKYLKKEDWDEIVHHYPEVMSMVRKHKIGKLNL